MVIAQDCPELQEFIATVSSALAASTPGTMLTAGIKDAYIQGIGELSSTAGVELLTPADSQASTLATGCAVQGALLQASAAIWLANARLEQEVFGPTTTIVVCADRSEMIRVAQQLRGHLTATIHHAEGEIGEFTDLFDILREKAGRLVHNAFPTGVEVCDSMVHGGPYPATSDVRSTSVGTNAIRRFLRPICYQDAPQEVLPLALKNENPLGILRRIDGTFTSESISHNLRS